MMTPLSRTLRTLIGGAVLAFLGWLAVLGASWGSGEIPGSPVHNWHWLVAQIFAGNPDGVSDREAAAITDASEWFSSAVLPPVVAGLLGLAIGALFRPGLKLQSVALAVFAALHVDLNCCSVTASTALGAVGFGFSLVGGVYLGRVAKEGLSKWQAGRLGV